MSRTDLAGLLALSLPLTVLAGCGKKNGAAHVKTDTYTYLSIGDIESLDPAWARDTASQSVILQIYDNLVSYKGSSLNAFEPAVAEKIPTKDNGLLSKDGRTYTFPIRKGITFHDGSPLSAEDVRYSILRFCLLDRSGGPSVYILEALTGRRATRKNGKPDPHIFQLLTDAVRVRENALELRLPKAYPPLLGVLATWSPVVSKAWAASHGDWAGREETWPVHNDPKLQDAPFFDRAMGSGPFRLDRWSKKNKTVILRRFKDYRRGPPRLAKAVIKAVPEFSTRRLMLKAGDADSIYAERTEYTALSGLDGVEIIDDLSSAAMNPVLFFTFRINPEANPYIGSGRLDGRGIPSDFFSNRDTRLGFAYSVDADAFIRDVSKDKAEPAAGCIPKTVFGFDPDLPRRPFDLKKAEKHFRLAAGGAVWKKGFRLTLAYNSGNEPRGVLARMVKRNVESINPKFKIDVRPVLWPTYLAALNARKIPAFVIGWMGSYPDPDAYAAPFLHSDEFFARMQGFSDKELDRMIERAKLESDKRLRKEMYSEIQKRAHHLAAQVYVQHERVYRAQRSWVRGYRYHPMFPAAPHFSRLFGLSKSPSR